MRIAVRYYTRSGNTEKLANAVAAAASVEARDVSVPLTDKTDVVFLGCSYYAFDVDDAVKTFITQNHDNIGKLVCFGTSAMMRSVRKPVSKVAESVGVAVATEEFHCRGRFGKLHKERPNAQDLANASAFVRAILANEGETSL